MASRAPPIRFRAARPPHPHMHRHHIIPVRLFRKGPLSPFLSALRGAGVWANDFTRNGLFLPSREEEAVALHLPLHRGPHRLYSDMVAARLDGIARSYRGPPAPPLLAEAAWRVRMMQAALTRTLAEARLARPLNRFDPMLRAQDFTQIDAMIDRLWADSAEP